MTYSQHKIFNGFKQVEIPYWAVISHLHKLVKPIYVSTQMKPLPQPKPLNTLVTLNVGVDKADIGPTSRVNKLSGIRKTTSHSKG